MERTSGCFAQKSPAPFSSAQARTTAHKKTPALLGLANLGDSSPLSEVAGAGFEPTTSRL